MARMNDTLLTLGAMLRMVCNVLIVAGTAVGGLFVGLIAGVAFTVFTLGVAGDWSTGGMILGALVGAAHGIRRCWPPAPKAAA